MKKISYDYENYWDDKKFDINGREKYYNNLYGDVEDFYLLNDDDEVLDVAGGNGCFANYIGAKNVTIIDISTSGLKLANKHFNYKTIKIDLVNDDWDLDKKYDVIICNEFLEHVESPGKILKKIHNVIKDSGKLYIGQPDGKADGQHHITRLNFSCLKNILQNSNFRIVDHRINSIFNGLKFSNIKRGQPFKYKVKIFMAAYVSLLIPKLVKKYLTYKYPDRFGQFSHVVAVKNGAESVQNASEEEGE